MLELICSTCGKRVQGEDSVAGQRASCPVCHAEMTVPNSDAACVTAIATADHALLAKVATTATPSDTCFQEGLPPTPLAPSPLRAQEIPRVALRWVPYVIVAFMVAGVVALLTPAVQKVREASARTQSVNNLKQIGLGMQSFHDGNKRLPFNGIPAGTRAVAYGSNVTYFGNATTDCPSSGSWLFQIMPYVDQNALFHLSGIAESDAIPSEWLNTGVATYMCPGRGRQAFKTDAGPWSDYHINVMLNASEKDSHGIGFNVPDVKRTLLGITDGSSNTIFAGHGYIDTAQYTNTGDMGNWSDSMYKGGTEGTGRALGVPIPTQIKLGTGPATRLLRDGLERVTGVGYATSPQPWGGPFPQGALFAWCDGTVRMVPYSTTQTEAFTNFGSYLTPTNGESATLCD